MCRKSILDIKGSQNQAAVIKCKGLCLVLKRRSDLISPKAHINYGFEPTIRFMLQGKLKQEFVDIFKISMVETNWDFTKQNRLLTHIVAFGPQSGPMKSCLHLSVHLSLCFKTCLT